MDKNTFWDIIEKANKQADGNLSKMTEELDAQFSNMTPQDLMHFSFIFETYELAVINSKGLIWDALYIINGGYCSDTYQFAGWLIAQGENTYHNVLANPDMLADTNANKDSCKYGDFRKLAPTAYKNKTKVKVRQYQKLESEFWLTDRSEKEKVEIEAEIVVNTTPSPASPDIVQPFTNKSVRKAQESRIEILKPFLPKLYAKFGFRNITDHFKA